MNHKVFELTENLDILTDQNLTFKEFCLFGVKLFDDVNSINMKIITSTRMESLPENSNNWSLDENEKVYIFQNNVKREFKLCERIESVINNSGRLFTFEKYGYGIKNRKVVEFIIPEYRIKNFKIVNRKNIEFKFGKPDLKKEDYDYQHGELMSTYYFYESKKMKIELDELDNEINFIFLGEELKK